MLGNLYWLVCDILTDLRGKVGGDRHSLSSSLDQVSFKIYNYNNQ